MSAAQRQIAWISPEEYLIGEEDSPVRHEYIDGQVFAMAGANTPHGRIALNLATAVDTHLRDLPCETFIADMKVGISRSGPYYYPDVLVTCNPGDLRRNSVKRHPRLIVEVLSPHSGVMDRGCKLDDYQSLASLQEYVLVSQDRLQVECFRRGPDGEWKAPQVYTEGDEVRLESIDLTLPIERIYNRVRFGPYDVEDEDGD